MLYTLRYLVAEPTVVNTVSNKKFYTTFFLEFQIGYTVVRALVSTYRTMATSNTVLDNLENFADAITGQDKYIHTQEEMIENIALLEAVTQSAVSGKLIKV